MKKYISIFLLFISLSQPLQYFWVRVSFELNRTYIAQNLCENRAKPELKCGGQCFLMKKLAEKKQQEQKNTENVEIILATSLFQNPPAFHFKQTIEENEIIDFSSFLSFYTQNCILSTFHPPCA
ncbi:MAG: hypothetical protein MUC49_04660 [Raineya sp.]|nr:hypothetical protein [Raineya sp.]